MKKTSKKTIDPEKKAKKTFQEIVGKLEGILQQLSDIQNDEVLWLEVQERYIEVRQIRAVGALLAAMKAVEGVKEILVG